MAVTNGWGKGVENNTIGWGKSADNATNGFGSVYASSAAGDTLLGSGGTFDPDAQVYFTAVEDAGGTLTDNVKDEFNAFVVREKDAGRWSKIKRLYPYLGGVIDSAIIDAVTTNAATNSNFVDADADATIGLQGDGSTKYLTDVSTYSSIVNSQYKVQQGAIYIGETGETSIPYLFGAINSGNYIASRYFNSSLIRSYVGLVLPYSQYAATIPTSASVVAARYSTTSAYTIVNNNTDLQDTSTTIYSFPTVAPSYFKANGAGGVSNGKYSCHFISEFDTLQETKDFTTSYKTFINNIQAYAALMDSYSGASAAYSLRKVYSTYEGSAINVRRSSDNATQDIGFDGYILDEAALLSFVGAGNGFVTTWYDQSGNGVNLSQSTAAQQPQIVSSGIVLVSGSKPAIKWDGTDDSLGTITGELTEARLDSYFVHHVDAAEDYYIYPTRANGSALGFGFVAREGNTSTTIYNDYGTPTLYANGALADTTNRATIFTALDGRRVVVHQAADTTAFSGGYGLGNYANVVYFSGYFAEVILYDSDQSTNRTAIEALINTYYNIY